MVVQQTEPKRAEWRAKLNTIIAERDSLYKELQQAKNTIEGLQHQLALVREAAVYKDPCQYS